MKMFSHLIIVSTLIFSINSCKCYHPENSFLKKGETYQIVSEAIVVLPSISIIHNPYDQYEIGILHMLDSNNPSLKRFHNKIRRKKTITFLGKSIKDDGKILYIPVGSRIRIVDVTKNTDGRNYIDAIMLDEKDRNIYLKFSETNEIIDGLKKVGN